MKTRISAARPDKAEVRTAIVTRTNRPTAAARISPAIETRTSAATKTIKTIRPAKAGNAAIRIGTTNPANGSQGAAWDCIDVRKRFLLSQVDPIGGASVGAANFFHKLQYSAEWNYGSAVCTRSMKP